MNHIEPHVCSLIKKFTDIHIRYNLLSKKNKKLARQICRHTFINKGITNHKPLHNFDQMWKWSRFLKDPS